MNQAPLRPVAPIDESNAQRPFLQGEPPDLHFVPLSEERFDLVVPSESLADPRVAQLLETLDSQAFRAELGTLEGYATRQSGHRIAEVA